MPDDINEETLSIIYFVFDNIQIPELYFFKENFRESQKERQISVDDVFDTIHEILNNYSKIILKNSLAILHESINFLSQKNVKTEFEESYKEWKETNPNKRDLREIFKNDYLKVKCLSITNSVLSKYIGAIIDDYASQEKSRRALTSMAGKEISRYTENQIGKSVKEILSEYEKYLKWLREKDGIMYV